MRSVRYHRFTHSHHLTSTSAAASSYREPPVTTHLTISPLHSSTSSTTFSYGLVIVDSAYVGNFTRIYTKLKLFASHPFPPQNRRKKKERTRKSYLGNKITRFLLLQLCVICFVVLASSTCSFWFLLCLV